MDRITERQAALVAGVGYVFLFAAAIFANLFVIEGLVVADDAAQTASNLVESQGLFRAGIVAFLGVGVVDAVVSYALYVVFRRANEKLSRLAAWFRLAYSLLLVGFLALLALALDHATSGRSQEALDSIESFTNAWAIGLSLFGVHLIAIGWLGQQSRALPRVLGWLLVAAGLAYLIDASARLILGNYADYETALTTIVAVPSALGEAWFGLWLLIRGGKADA